MPMNQLSLDLSTDSKPTKRKRASLTTCRCGHDVGFHRKQTGKCLRHEEFQDGSWHSQCSCKRFRARGRVEMGELELPDWLTPSPNAVILTRPDTVRPKAMGWALREGECVTIYLSQLRTKTPNFLRWMHHANLSPARQRQMDAAIAAANKSQVTRTQTAIEESDKPVGLPASVEILRVTSGLPLDDDNLAGTLKYIRDGIADGLRINDSLFSMRGVPGKIPLIYSQRPPGKRGIRGVQIILNWKADEDGHEEKVEANEAGTSAGNGAEHGPQGRHKRGRRVPRRK